MKSKDIIGLAILGVVLAIVGTLLLGNIGSGGEPRTAEIEVVRAIDPTLNQEARTILLGGEESLEVDVFTAPQNLRSGFGNNDPFN